MLKKSIPIFALFALTLSPMIQPALANPTPNPMTNRDWWPKQLNLQPLRQHAAESNPLGPEFNYAKEFKSLDLSAVKETYPVGFDPKPRLVAGRLWQLWPLFHPHGLAQCRHLSHG